MTQMEINSLKVMWERLETMKTEGILGQRGLEKLALEFVRNHTPALFDAAQENAQTKNLEHGMLDKATRDKLEEVAAVLWEKIDNFYGEGMEDMLGGPVSGGVNDPRFTPTTEATEQLRGELTTILHIAHTNRAVLPDELPLVQKYCAIADELSAQKKESLHSRLESATQELPGTEKPAPDIDIGER